MSSVTSMFCGQAIQRNQCGTIKLEVVSNMASLDKIVIIFNGDIDVFSAVQRDIVYDLIGSQKSKMASLKPEIPISQHK